MTKIPKAREAEQIILGTLLGENEDVSTDIIGRVKPDEFYWQEHRTIYRAILDLYDQNKPTDLVTIKDHLEANAKLNKANGLDYLADLQNKVITTANISHYVNIVKEKATLRRIIKSGKEISELGRKEDLDINEVLDKAENKVFEISQRGGDTGYSLMSDLLSAHVDHLEELHHSDQEVVDGIETGFSDLDHKLSGLKKTKLYTMAGRPGMGKTGLALAIARKAALQDYNVGIFSLEMPQDSIMNRILCGDARVNLQRAEDGRLSKQDFGKLAQSANKFNNKTLAIEDTPHMPVIDVKAEARRMKAKEDIDLIIVDYLQLMQGSGQENNREQEVAKMTRSLKALALELEIPIIAVAQLNREVEYRKDKRPKLADLRESGAIEQDSNVVIFVYRENYYEDEISEVDETEVIIAKQRNGPTGTVNLAFHKKYASFYERAPGGV